MPEGEQKTVFHPEEKIFRKQTEAPTQESLTRVLTEDAFRYDRDAAMQSTRSTVLQEYEKRMTVSTSKQAEIDRFSASFKSETSESKRNVKKHLAGSAIHAKQKNAEKIEEEEKKAGDLYEKRMYEALDYAEKAGYEDRSTTHVLMRDLSCFFLSDEKSASANKKLITNAVNPDTAWDALETCKIRFLEMSMEDLDLRSDESFAKESARLEEISQKTVAIKRLFGANPDYWEMLPQHEREILSAKIEQCDRIIPYYRAKKAVIKNPYYSSHYNSELTGFKKSDQTPEQREVGDLIRNLGLAEYFFKNGESPEAKAAYLADRHFEEGDQEWERKINVFKSVAYKQQDDGGFIGAVESYLMQFTSWIMRKKRNEDHGESRYEESVAKMKKLPAMAKNIAEGKPVTWRRGNSPNIILSKYFQDPHKLELRSSLEGAPTDDQDLEYKKAKEALTHYVDIAGIVNRDTTEMEMAFLDTFLKSQKAWLEQHGADSSPEMAAKKTFLQTVAQKITTLGNGSLGDDMDAEEFRYMAERSEIISEDTKLLPNLERSNIRDIPLFLHTPNINDVKQSTIGDCWLLSAFTTLVSVNPDYITHMMKDLGDGTVMVRLYVPELESQKVNGTIVSQKVYNPKYFRIRKDYETGNGNACDCTWVQILEKACAVSGFAGNGQVDLKEGKIYNMARELTGGDAGQALTFLLGREVKTYDPSRDPDCFKAAQLPPITEANQKFVLRELISGLPKHLQDLVSDKLTAYKEGTSIDSFMEALEQSFTEDQQLFAPQLNEISGLLEQKVGQAGTDAIMARLNTITSTGGDLEKYKMRLRRNFDRLASGKDVFHDGVELSKFSAEKLREMLGGIIQKLNTSASSGDALLAELTADTEEIFGQATINESSKAELKATIAEADCDLYGVEALKDKQSRDRYTDRKGNAVYRVKKYAHRFLYGNKGRYNPEQIEFLSACKETIDAGGAVSLSLPGHFLSIVDTQYRDGTWYLLIKDPFNTYNKEYGKAKKPGGKESVSSEAFGDVFNVVKDYHKRNLSDDEETSVLGGFRGLSWWKLEDVYQQNPDDRQFTQCINLSREDTLLGPKTFQAPQAATTQGGSQ